MKKFWIPIDCIVSLLNLLDEEDDDNTKCIWWIKSIKAYL